MLSQLAKANLGEPSKAQIERLVQMALDEDAPWGRTSPRRRSSRRMRCLSCALVAPRTRRAQRRLHLRHGMMLTDPEIITRFFVRDGAKFEAGEVLATVEGPARGILQAERIALNFVQRLSGIATLTARYVAAISGTRARIVDIRKTTPGLRLLERYAVRCGGGAQPPLLALRCGDGEG